MSTVLKISSNLTSLAAEHANISPARRRSASVSVPVALYSPPKDGEFHVVSVSVSLADSLSSIAKWAAQIAPGSPPAPSPRTSSFYGSFTPRTSFSISTTPRTPAPKPVSPRDLLAQGYTSFVVHLPSLDRTEPDSPSPASKTAPALLPIPRPRPRTKSLSYSRGHAQLRSIDEQKPKTLTRLRSFSLKGKQAMHMLSSKSSAPAVPPVPALPNHMSSTKNASARPSSRSSSKAEKPTSKHSKTKSTPHARYAAILAPGGGAGALPLAQEVALSQMLDGGSLDANVKRVVARHTRDTGDKHSHRSVRDEVYSGRNGGTRRGEEVKDRRPVERREREREGGERAMGGGASGVYRDARGGLWWDEDEEVELAGLLPSDAPPSSTPAPGPLSTSNAHNINPNVNANGKEKKRGLLPRLMTSSKPPPTGPIPPAPAQAEWVPLHSPSARANAQEGGNARRGSATSDGSRDSELDATYAVRPRESSSFAGGFVPGYSVEKHLRRPARGIEAFSVSPLDVSGGVGASEQHVGGAECKRERRERKRPAPLTLPLPLPNPPASHPTSTSVSSHPSTARTHRTTAPQLAPIELANPMQPTRAEREGRHEYFASSFSPAPSSPLPTSAPGSARGQSHREGRSQNTKASRRGSISAGFSALGSALSATTKSARRASVATASPTSPSPFTHAHANVLNGKNGSSAHLPVSGYESVGAVSGSGIASMKGKSLRGRASRSKLAGLFKRG